MTNALLKITLIIFLNLLAFLSIGIILGALFGNRAQFLVYSVIISIIPLSIFLYIEIKKTLNKLNNISKNNKKDEGNTK
ncbi:hypothetical protein H3C61_00725 [Candidatus Gracilibacteria bacterium]|nr:hypothetical protein [Candidatus Gracilibacteria bacterium]